MAAIRSEGAKCAAATLAIRKKGTDLSTARNTAWRCFARFLRDAPLVVVEAVWQYSHHLLHGLYTHRGPILTVANWSGEWPGLVGHA